MKKLPLPQMKSGRLISRFIGLTGDLFMALTLTRNGNKQINNPLYNQNDTCETATKLKFLRKDFAGQAFKAPFQYRTPDQHLRECPRLRLVGHSPIC
jgi:hypothetical protein